MSTLRSHIDVVLEVETNNETVTVTSAPALVQTADTQLGQTIESKQVVSIPLNGRSYTDLLAVQPGVIPVTTSGAGNSSSGGGFGTVPAAGETNTGQFSINGQRESDNAYYLNGSSVQESIGQQAGIIPNLDSIAEFRILSSNVDAEYGSFTGGLINVVTKSGANAFHGDVFEFLRNTNLDARNYFSPERASFHQNQYGGTLLEDRSARTRRSSSSTIRDRGKFRALKPGSSTFLQSPTAMATLVRPQLSRESSMDPIWPRS